MLLSWTMAELISDLGYQTLSSHSCEADQIYIGVLVLLATPEYYL